MPGTNSHGSECATLRIAVAGMVVFSTMTTAIF